MVRKYPKYLLWLIPLILYAVLFEFILPLNKILPGPTLILESFGALYTTYDLFFNLFYTSSGIYVSIILSYLFIYLTAGNTIRMFHGNKENLRAFIYLKYFPLIGIIIIFIFWFPTSNIAEYFFSISYSLLFLYRVIFSQIDNVKGEYINSAKSLGMSSPAIYSKVYWKSIQPAVFKNLINLHNSLWTIMVIYEFIKGDLGIGYIFKLALEYNDVSVLLTLSIIVGLVLFTGNFVINYLNKKIIYWEN